MAVRPNDIAKRSGVIVAAILALAAIVLFDATPPAQAQGYLRAAPYGYGAYGYGGPYGYGAYGLASPSGSYMSYGYEYYLPAEQHRMYDRNSTDFNS
jgi:hypothetical protein